MPAIGGLQAANGIAKLAGGGYSKIYENSTELYNRMAKGKGKKFGSRGFEIPTETSGVFTHGFPADGGALPAGESIVTIRPVVFPTRYMHAVQLTGASMEELSANRKDISYVESWTNMNIDNVVDSAHKMVNIYLHGNGNGVLGTVSTGANSTTQTLSNNDNTRYLRKGMRVAFWDPTFTTLRGTEKITSDPEPGATTITIANAVNTTTSDVVTISGGPNKAPTGLKHIIDDGSQSNVYFQNVSRTLVPKYKAQLTNASSGTISTTLLRRILGAKLYPALGTLKRSEFEIWSHECQWSDMTALGWTMKQYEGKSKSLDLGFTALEWEGIPWVTEVDYEKTVVDFINWKTIQKYETKPFGWDETTGSIFNRVPSATTGSNYDDIFEGYYDVIFNMGSPDPRANARIYGLAVRTGF